MKKIFLFFLMLSGFLTLGLGCKGLSAEQQSAIQPVTINYWTVFGNVDELKKMATAYKQIRPYVTVNIRQIRYEEFDNLFVNALADDVGPDIVSMHTRWLGKYQNRLASMPSSVKVANIVVKGKYQPETIVTIENNQMPSLTAIKDQYVSAVAEDVAIGGKIYGLPLSVDTLALIYNKDLLDRAGVPLVPATWDDLVAAAKKATKYDKKGAIVQSGVALGTSNNIDSVFDLVSILMMQNGVVMSNNNRVTFANGLEQTGSEVHPTLQALRFYTDFARPTKDVYSWNSQFSNAITEFSNGKVAFLVGFAYDAARIRRLAPQLNLAVAPLPQLSAVNPVNVANYWVESVAKKSKHQDEAWDFIRFISSPDTVKRYSASLGEPSPLRVHIASEKEDPQLSPFANEILYAKNWYHGRDIDVAISAFKNLVNNYLIQLSDKDAQNQSEYYRRIILNAAAVVQQTL